MENAYVLPIVSCTRLRHPLAALRYPLSSRVIPELRFLLASKKLIFPAVLVDVQEADVTGVQVAATGGVNGNTGYVADLPQEVDRPLRNGLSAAASILIF